MAFETVPILPIPPFINTTYTGLPTPPSAPNNGARASVESSLALSHGYAKNAVDSANQFIASLSGLSNQIVRVGAVNTALNAPPALSLAALDQLISARPAPLNFTSPVPVPDLALISNMIAAPAGNAGVFTEAQFVGYANQAMTVIMSWINGASTGLSPTVEQALWDRARSREYVSSQRKIGDIVRQYASKGFPAPQGAMFVAMQSALQESQSAVSEVNRDVAIKQAELEQANRHFALEMAAKFEQILSDAWTAHMGRLLEDAKRLQQYTIDLFQQQVALEGMKTQRFSAKLGADVDVYKADADIGIAKLRADTEVYTAGAQVYGAKAQAMTAEFKANIDLEIARASSAIEASKANVQAMIQKVGLQVEAVKAGATVAAQLAAASLSAVNVSAGISQSSNDSASMGQSWSFGISKHESSSVSVSQSRSDNATLV
jgi:hypothetical protein